ncbi:XdhC family protein [Tianweitania sediminis]|uniref:XdhC family protein n=1 Tax=Tianweitania sediminis TaxID=1502156 RepID=A0A8J7R5L9_9HYPH|nr:XdhC family protein [Tianweitania sediminis]MBP0440260.1 XdhC family protein [Tianweitania sediminis]
MHPAILQQLQAERQARRAAVLVTDLATGLAELVRDADRAGHPLSEPLSKALQSGAPVNVEQEGRSLFLNPYLPPLRIVVIGAVHISQALAPMAALAGFSVEIIDPRTAFATPDRFSTVRLYPDWPEAVLQEEPLDRYCAVAALTHDPKIDDWPIEAALRAECFYVGALGSRKTHGKRLERLRSAGLTDDHLERIRAPIGLPIRASSPAEIAVAVLAEIIAAWRSPERAGAST